MSAYDFNSDECLQVFHRITEKIPSGVSDSDLREICPRISSSHELLDYIKNSITSMIKKDIEWLWINYHIPEKLKHLRELEEKSAKRETWRPTTGEADLKHIMARNLLERKMELLKQIEEIAEESSMLTSYLKKHSKQCKEQLEEIASVEKELLDLKVSGD